MWVDCTFLCLVMFTNAYVIVTIAYSFQYTDVLYRFVA